eukprot:jgi/Chrzof1/11080/Cz05g22210.t1
MEDAVARRERLKALKQAADLANSADQPSTAPSQAAEEPAKPVLKFRNYVVRDEHIQHEQVAPAQPPKLEDAVIESKPEEANQEELLANVAPKKANWDLKRDVAAKLEKLERRTQRALVGIMQEEEAQRFQEDGIQD